MAGSDNAAVALIERHWHLFHGFGPARAEGDPAWILDRLGYRVLHAVDRAGRGSATTADAAIVLQRLVNSEESIECLERSIEEAEAEAVGLRALLDVEQRKVADLAAEVDRLRDLRRAMLSPTLGLRFVAAWIRGGRS